MLAGGIRNKIQKDMSMEELSEDKNEENDASAKVRNHLKRRVVK